MFDVIQIPRWYLGQPEYHLEPLNSDIKYKGSYYNHIIDYDDENYILYNAFNSSTVLFHSSKFKEIENVLNQNYYSSENVDPEIFENLHKSRFIIPNSIQEKELMKNRLNNGRQRKDMLYLTIAPTIGCNFNCTYCIEDESFRKDFTVMSASVIEQIVKLAEDNIKKHNIKRLSVAWFGGEPLLAIDQIDILSKKLVRLCEKNNVIFDCCVNSNGFLLNQKAIDILVPYKPNFVKISLDGPENIHNKRRVLLSGGATYKKILNNIKKASEKLRILIRINVDQSNYETIIQLLDEISAIKNEQNNNISIYLGIVEENEFITDKFKTYISRKRFAETDLKFTIEASKRKLAQSYLPTALGNFCGADLQLGYMIGPKGEMYSCWAEFGDPTKIIGYVGTDIGGNEAHLKHYSEFDPTEHEKCSTCKVLPICTGGCSRERLFHGEPQCGVYKYNLNERITTYVTQLKKSNQSLLVELKNLEQAEKELLFGTSADHASIDRKIHDRWGNSPATFQLNDFDKLLSLLFAKTAERDR